MKTANLSEAYAGSYYTICGAGGDLSEWENGLSDMLVEEGVGKPVAWFQTTGKDINEFAATRGTVTNPFGDDLTVIMFPYTGLHTGKLAILKLRAGDRWFDDIVDNMIEANYDEDEED